MVVRLFLQLLAGRRSFRRRPLLTPRRSWLLMLSAMAVVACLLAVSLAGKDGGEGERRERLLGEEEVAKREREREREERLAAGSSGGFHRKWRGERGEAAERGREKRIRIILGIRVF